MKKVLIIANHIDWVYSLRKELIEKLSEIYRVIICIPECKDNNKLDYFKSINVDFAFVNFQGRDKNPFKDIGVFIKYLNTIKSLNPNVIITYTIKPNIYGSIAGKLLRKKVVINVTGLGTGFHSNKVVKLIAKNLYSIGCKASYHVFFQNTNNMSLFINNKMVERSKCSLIPGSGVNIEKFKPMEKTKEDDIIRFLFIGRIMKEKGIEEYLQVAESLIKKYSNIEFQILGSFEEDRYKDIIYDNKNERIKYLGRSDDVRNEIREVDCIVNPSYHEGMSNVLLEGAAMGKPLIASNIPGCKEIIEEGYNGYLFELKSVESMEEKLIQFIELDEESKEIMGKNSRRKVEKEFDRNIVINEYMKVIKDILKEGRQYESI